PVYYPQSKTDGSIDYLGGLMANPFIMERLADAAGALMTAGAGALQRMQAMTPQQRPALGVGAPQAHAQVVQPQVQQVPAQPAPQPQAQPAPLQRPQSSGWPDA